MTTPFTIAAMQAMREHMATTQTLSLLEGFTIEITEGAVFPPQLSILAPVRSVLSLMP